MTSLLPRRRPSLQNLDRPFVHAGPRAPPRPPQLELSIPENLTARVLEAAMSSPSTGPICCAAVAPSLYLGNEAAARSLPTLLRLGVTHVLNAAAFTCEETPGVENLSLWLRDAADEDLACVLLDALEWIRAALAAGGVVLLHCVAGKSRGAAIAVAHLMQTFDLAYEAALERLRETAPACEPNIGFAMTLCDWGSPPADAPPRLFLVQPHSAADPQRLVIRPVAPAAPLDERCAFVLRSATGVFVWRGAGCSDAFASAASRIGARLLEFDRSAGGPLTIVSGTSAELEALLAAVPAGDPLFDAAAVDAQVQMHAVRARSGPCFLDGVGASEMFASADAVSPFHHRWLR